MQTGLAARVAVLPDGEDPDTFIQTNGSQVFANLIADARSALDFQIDVIEDRTDIKSEAGLIRATRSVLDTIRISPSAVQQAHLLQQAANRLGIPSDALKAEMDGTRRPERSQRAEQNKSEKPVSPATPPSREEWELVEHLVADTTLAQLIIDYLPLSHIKHPTCYTLLDVATSAFKERRSFASALGDLDDPQGNLQAAAAKAQMAENKATGRDFSRQEAVQDLLLYIHRRNIKEKRDRLQRQWENGDQSVMELIRECTNDLNLLRRWETGQTTLELLVVSEDEAGPDTTPQAP